MSRHVLAPLALSLVLAAGCGGAAAPTGPAPAAETKGLASPVADVVFTTSVRDRRTVVIATDAATGEVLARQPVAGRFDLPRVTRSGMLGGISPDGRTLVLAERDDANDGDTRFAVLNASLDKPPQFLQLTGSFAFDALSPDAERLFLIQHLPPTGSAHYRVRMLHLATGKLDPTVIVDKRFPDERMQGYPLARAESDDGLWVYTLYRDGARNFVHALMTDGAALCIDLPAASSPEGPWILRLEPGQVLRVTNTADGAGSAIDLGSLTVRAA